MEGVGNKDAFNQSFISSRRLYMANLDPVNKGTPLPRGAYSRIARRLRPKVSPQHVRKVALGERESKRVSAAIERFRESLTTAA